MKQTGKSGVDLGDSRIMIVQKWVFVTWREWQIGCTSRFDRLEFYTMGTPRERVGNITVREFHCAYEDHRVPGRCLRKSLLKNLQ